jgi:hypothetical protein
MATEDNGRRVFIWLTVLYAIQFLTIFTIVYQMIVIRRLRRDRDSAIHNAYSFMIVLQAFMERAVTIDCDDCGNPMGADDSIDVLERPDGSTYIGHRSHNRRMDWGPV